MGEYVLVLCSIVSISTQSFTPAVTAEQQRLLSVKAVANNPSDDMSFLHKPSAPALRSENTNNIVTIDLSNHPPNAKLGMLLAPGSLPAPLNSNSDSNNTSSPATSSAALRPTASNVTLVAGWEHGTNQPLGPIQRSGMVRLGDRLVRINGRDITDWSFREVMDVLKEMITTNNNNNNTVARRKRRLTTLGFAPSGTDEWSRGVIVGGEEFNSTSMLFGLFQSQEESKVSPHVISKRLYSFVSFVGRWRVVDEPVAVDVASQRKSDSVEEVEQSQQQDDDLQQQQQQQQRQISENSTDLLEEQLNKEPSMKFDDDGPIDIPEHDAHNEITDDNQSPKQSTANKTTTATATPSIFSSEAEAEWHKEINEFQQNNRPPTKKIVQYELQCHLLLRHDPNSSFSPNNTSSRHHGGIGIRNKNAIHHSWSVWKRYSEFQSLDTELRNTFGWQMDAIDDGKGIVFPSVHGLESWWYGWRNGGGYLTSLLGGSYGVEVADDDDRKVEEEADNDTNEKENTKRTVNGGGNAKKRQKELTAYWISLSRVEDIFEFSDINSHRFGRLMASFLEVDQVLLSRRSNSRSTTVGTASNQQRYPQPTSPSRLTVPVIHENETELYSFGARKSEQWLSPTTRDFSGITFNDDDVSMLSDGTGANAYLTSLQNNYSPVGPARRLLVDNVPAEFTSNNPPLLNGAENRSVSSKSAQKRVGGSRGASRKTKPAFQRQLID
eukprot:scaffold8941_cov145-Skeletonema_menzelii.AAC.2